MKIFISVDIEGVTGICDWKEASNSNSSYEYFRKQMTKEVNAACEGINEVGEFEILVKDAHGSARNIIPSELPKNVKIHRGWSESPLIMMEGLDKSFDAVMFIGYHSGAFMEGNPLAHSFNTDIQYIKLNGNYTSEFELNLLISNYYGVPVIFLSGDDALCKNAEKNYKNITTVSVSEGIGDSSISIHPDLAIEKIKNKVIESLKTDFEKCKVDTNKKFEFEIQYKESKYAFKASFYPGVEKRDNKTIKFVTDDYYEFMRMLLFI